MKERMAPFSFTTIWRAGKEHVIPDALSRAPVDDPVTADQVDEHGIELNVGRIVAAVTANLNETDQTDADINNPSVAGPLLARLRQTASVDDDYKLLHDAITTGFPTRIGHLSPALRPYWSVRSELSADDGLVLKGNRLVIPAAARSDTLVALHSSHQIIDRTKRRARQTVWWPAINSDIVNTINTCSACQMHQPSQQREPHAA